MLVVLLGFDPDELSVTTHSIEPFEPDPELFEPELEPFEPELSFYFVIVVTPYLFLFLLIANL